MRIIKGRDTSDRQEGCAHEVMVLVDTDGSRDKAGVEHCHRVCILESDRDLFSGKPFSHRDYTQHCVSTHHLLDHSLGVARSQLALPHQPH